MGDQHERQLAETTCDLRVLFISALQHFFPPPCQIWYNIRSTKSKFRCLTTGLVEFRNKLLKSLLGSRWMCWCTNSGKWRKTRKLPPLAILSATTAARSRSHTDSATLKLATALVLCLSLGYGPVWDVTGEHNMLFKDEKKQDLTGIPLEKMRSLKNI